MRRSLRWRLVLVFLVLALALAVTFIGGVRRRSGGLARTRGRCWWTSWTAWPGGRQPAEHRARQALVQRLPITIRIEGPQVNWASHPSCPGPHG